MKVVKWMVNHVTQFPSDQEMTRYISTVSDKVGSMTTYDKYAPQNFVPSV
jgi:hypothetical protein